MDLWIFEDETILTMFADADRIARNGKPADCRPNAQQVADLIAVELVGRGFRFDGTWHR